MTLEYRKREFWNPKADRVLALILAAALFITVLLCVLLFFSIRQQAIASRQLQAEREVSILTRFLNHYFTNLLKSQKSFAASHSEAKATSDVKLQMKVLRDAFRGEFINAVSLISPDLKLIHTEPESDKIGADLSSLPHNIELAATNLSVVSSPFQAVQGYKAIAVSTPLKGSDGKFNGAITYLVDFDSLISYLVRKVDLSQQADIHVIDSRQGTLYSTGRIPGGSLRNIIFGIAHSNSRGFFSHQIKDSNGDEVTHLVAYSFLILPSGTKWMICMDIPQPSLLPRQQMLMVLAYAVPIAFFLIVVVSLGLIRWLFISRHTISLEKTLAAERESLDAANSRLALMLESLPYMIFELDSSGKFTFLRVSHCIKDCEESNLLGENIQEKLAFESRGSFKNAFDHILTTGKALHALRISLICCDDAPPKICSLSAFPVFDDDKSVIGVNGIMHDITERMALESSLIQSQKMEVVGSVTNSVAHDFNNYLATMMGCVDLIRLKNPELENLDILRRALNKAAVLTEQLLSFSRKSRGESESCDINEALKQTVKMLKKTKAGHISIKFNLASSLPDVLISQSKLDQIVMNLVVNACDAMPNGGEVTVRTWKLELDSIYAEQLNLPVGEYVMLEISDNGPGMDEKTRTRVFEPYFTTKKNGTGLGLATVFTIVKQMNGRVILNSTPGRGSTFSIYIPVHL